MLTTVKIVCLIFQSISTSQLLFCQQIELWCSTFGLKKYAVWLINSSLWFEEFRPCFSCILLTKSLFASIITCWSIVLTYGSCLSAYCCVLTSHLCFVLEWGVVSALKFPCGVDMELHQFTLTFLVVKEYSLIEQPWINWESCRIVTCFIY